MFKNLTLCCKSCDFRNTYRIGSGKDLATLKDVIGKFEDQKEKDKLLDFMSKATKVDVTSDLLALYDNHAEPLSHINYEACGAGVKLYPPETFSNPYVQRFLSQDIKNKLAISHFKWIKAFEDDGVVAFKALYYCRKCKRIQKGIFLKIKFTDGQKERTYAYVNRCDRCKNETELVDDANSGFIYEGQPTVGMCEKCGAPLYVEGVNFSQKIQ